MNQQELASAVCQQLHLIAKLEADKAADLAAASPYWKPTPTEVLAHRAAARELREVARRLERGHRPPFDQVG